MEISETAEAQEAPRAQFTDKMLASIEGMRKWAMFLSIVGFVFTGILVVFALTASTVLGAGPLDAPFPGFQALIASIYLITAGVYFLAVFFLFRFATSAKNSFALGNEEGIETSFQFLNTHYKVNGIIMIVVISIYGLMFLLFFGLMFFEFF